MKTTFTRFSLPAIIIFLCAVLFSCDKKDDIQNPPAGAKLMKINNWTGSGDGTPYLSFEYDAAGKMTKAIESNYSDAISYNSDGTISTIKRTSTTNSNVETATFTYTSGKLTKVVTDKSPFVTTYLFDYNSSGKMSKITSSNPTAPNSFLYWEYTWTGDNITEVKLTSTSNPAPAYYYYEYDTKGNPYYGQYSWQVTDILCHSKNNITKQSYKGSDGNTWAINTTNTYNANGYLETKIISTGGEGLKFFYK